MRKVSSHRLMKSKCPFCKSNDLFICSSLNTKAVCVTCNSCGATGPLKRNKVKAIKAWNDYEKYL